jgi:DNA-binding response OmpR family regulator
MTERQQRVLIVESEPLLADALALALSARDCYAMRAITRHDGERILAEAKTDILIAHGHLAEDDVPFQFAIEASIRWPALAIVAVVNDPDIDHGFTLGRVHVLPKPFDLEAVTEAIRSAQRLVIRPYAPKV